MMKYTLFLFSLFAFITQSSNSQVRKTKPALDTSAYSKWPSLTVPSISNKGKYAFYTIDNQPVGNKTLVFVSTNGLWKKEIVGGENAVLVNDQLAIYQFHQSIFLVTLGSSTTNEINDIDSYKILSTDKNQLLAYSTSHDKNKVIIRNLKTGSADSINNIKDYQFMQEGTCLLVQSIVPGSNDQTHLQIIDLKSKKIIPVWKGESISSLRLDKSNQRILFITEKTTGATSKKEIWLHDRSSGTTSMVLSDDDLPGNNGIKYITTFSDDAPFLYVTIGSKMALPQAGISKVSLTIWSYQDQRLASFRQKQPEETNTSILYNIEKKSILYTGAPMEELSYFKNKTLIFKRNGNTGTSEWYWNSVCLTKVEILDNLTGHITMISDSTTDNYTLSLGGKYLIWLERKTGKLFSYSIGTGKTTTISKGIANLNRIPARWTINDTSFLISDQQDIWQFDPEGIRQPVNLTKQYSGKSNIIFSLADNSSGAPITDDQQLLVAAFDYETKENCIFKLRLGGKGKPESLNMAAYVYCAPQYAIGLEPVRANSAEVYIVKRQSEKESPNFFSTTDFKHFVRISDLHPENEYNWLQARLYKWTSLNGDRLHGILYLPEDFDSTKRYPVIFYYYEKVSDHLHNFINPELSDGRLNIAWYVSNGYLVFRPDVNFEIGKTGDCFFNSIVSAAKVLSKEKFVDSSKMGLQGISFGGYATNYLVTHSNLFAAACSSSGVADFVSGYGGIAADGASIGALYEAGQNRMGSTPWENPAAYIKNSPVFFADKVSTPFLMMHTTNDGICLFPNALELFTALRRLGKKAWLLEYGKWDHSLYDDESVDFDLRMRQYFDHYLKGKPAPEWMLKNDMNQITERETYLELNSGDQTPGPSRVHRP